MSGNEQVVSLFSRLLGWRLGRSLALPWWGWGALDAGIAGELDSFMG